MPAHLLRATCYDAPRWTIWYGLKKRSGVDERYRVWDFLIHDATFVGSGESVYGNIFYGKLPHAVSVLPSIELMTLPYLRTPHP